MHLALATACANATIVDLISDLPAFRPDLAAYLVPGISSISPVPCIHVCVVDPGVGSDRAAIALEADGNWYLGPDNGLLAIVARHASKAAWWRIDWRPRTMSRSFHGRDLFAPMAAQIACGELGGMSPINADCIIGSDWPDDLLRVVYCDSYGNLCSGVRVSSLQTTGTTIKAAGVALTRAGTFSEVPQGQAFWYENSLGLLEVAVNRGRADQVLELAVGDPLETC